MKIKLLISFLKIVDNLQNKVRGCSLIGQTGFQMQDEGRISFLLPLPPSPHFPTCIFTSLLKEYPKVRWVREGGSESTDWSKFQLNVRWVRVEGRDGTCLLKLCEKVRCVSCCGREKAISTSRNFVGL